MRVYVCTFACVSARGNQAGKCPVGLCRLQGSPVCGDPGGGIVSHTIPLNSVPGDGLPQGIRWRALGGG